MPERYPARTPADATPLELGQLFRTLSQPAIVPVSRWDWGYATMLATLRSASNEPMRTTGQDRGAMQNFLGDVQGSLAELLLLRELDAVLPDDALLRHCLYEPGGGGSQGVSEAVDAEVLFAEATVPAIHHRTRKPVGISGRQPPLRLGIEAKCHLDMPRNLATQLDVPVKRDFAVNDKAVTDSHRLSAIGFVPYVTTLGGSFAVRCGFVFLADVLRWPLVEYARGRDLARAVPLDEFLRQTCDMSLACVRSELGPPLSEIKLARIEVISTAVARHADDPRLAMLSSKPYRQALALLASLAREWIEPP
jgi:hypothetical protein